MSTLTKMTLFLFCFLSVQFTNAYKYSNSDKLEIVLAQKDNFLEMMVRNNGMNNGEDLKTSGMGIGNMKMRAARIGGKLEIDRIDGFEVIFKSKSS